MRAYLSGLLAPRRIAAWSAGLPNHSVPQHAVLQAIIDRWGHYQGSELDHTLSPDDDMLSAHSAEDVQHYLRTGLSALELIVEAMVLARKTGFGSILDLPCGGGRVTRHLVRFFSDSEIFVSDIERNKQAFVAAQFGVKAIDLRADFSAPAPGLCDLIFVGSLLTHLNEAMFCRAVDFFINTLAPEGVLIATTHGRYSATAIPAGRKHMAHDPIARTVAGPYARHGFGFRLQDRRRYGTQYGTSFTSPSWLAQLIERRTDVGLLGFKERAWDDHQDALIVQKLP